MEEHPGKFDWFLSLEEVPDLHAWIPLVYSEESPIVNEAYTQKSMDSFVLPNIAILLMGKLGLQRSISSFYLVWSMNACGKYVPTMLHREWPQKKEEEGEQLGLKGRGAGHMWHTPI